MKTLRLLTLCIAVCGCSPSAQPVAYYKSHRAALDKRLSECVARFEESEDCVNVKRAYLELHNLPTNQI